MRLLKCVGGFEEEPVKISLTEFTTSQTPPYAILSHRWRDEEVLFEHIISGSAYEKMKGYSKIESCARAALRAGLDYIWVDTCCINKASSAELSEAINSMYQWYKDSRICFAFLDDVSFEVEAPGFAQIMNSTWFTRGWTLQELIAPQELLFFTKEWVDLGSRIDLSSVVFAATRIDPDILRGTRPLDAASVAEKMSWAATRETTRVEDIAYSLMGLFSVNMPTIYGEGIRAFRRLQLEIMQTTNDHTLFAWQDTTCNGDMLAPSPSPFRGCDIFQPIAYSDFIFRFGRGEDPKPDFTMTNAGLHIQLPIMQDPEEGSEGLYNAFLACMRMTDKKMVFVRIFLERTETSDLGIGASRRSVGSAYRRVAKNGDTIRTLFNPPDNVSMQTVWIGASSSRARIRGLHTHGGLPGEEQKAG